MQERITICGEVVPGRRLGRTIGFPTANIELEPEQGGEERVRAGSGVWLARVSLEETGQRYWAVANIGRRPTVETQAGGGRYKAEAWLFDFDGDLYGRRIEVELVRFLRPERKFDSLEELRRAIERDKENALNIIANDEFTL